MPNENKEPTNKPATMNIANKASAESSNLAARKNAMTPPKNTKDSTFGLPNLSLSTPNGICDIILAAAKDGMMIERALGS